MRQPSMLRPLGSAPQKPLPWAWLHGGLPPAAGSRPRLTLVPPCQGPLHDEPPDDPPPWAGALRPEQVPAGATAVWAVAAVAA